MKHAQSTSVRELIHKIENHPDRRVFFFNKIYDKIKHIIHLVQKSKKMIQDVGNIELCELFETEPKTQSIAHAGISCRKKQRSIENSLNTRWTFFRSQSLSSRREELMDTDMGESQEIKNIIWLTN